LLRKSTRSDLITWKKMDYIDNKTKICSNTKSIDMTGLLRMLIYLNNKNYTNTISLFNKHKEFNHRIWNINDQIFIEVFPKQYNKYTAITYLRKYYGIKLNDILFFADHFNDIPAAKRIPNSFAVKNANSQLKNISKCITKFDNDHDGVARELESIFYANSRIR
jgi:hydroxymethylpyrimidine pyrophosphatase-like HAD family hydrolase